MSEAGRGSASRDRASDTAGLVVGWEDTRACWVGDLLPRPGEILLERTATLRRRHSMEDPFREELFVSEVTLPSILAGRRVPSCWGVIQEKSVESGGDETGVSWPSPEEVPAGPSANGEFRTIRRKDLGNVVGREIRGHLQRAWPMYQSW